MSTQKVVLNIWKKISNSLFGVGGVCDWVVYLLKQSLYVPYKLLFKRRKSWSIAQQDWEEVKQVCSLMKSE